MFGHHFSILAYAVGRFYLTIYLARSSMSLFSNCIIKTGRAYPQKAHQVNVTDIGRITIYACPQMSCLKLLPFMRVTNFGVARPRGGAHLRSVFHSRIPDPNPRLDTYHREVLAGIKKGAQYAHS